MLHDSAAARLLATVAEELLLDGYQFLVDPVDHAQGEVDHLAAGRTQLETGQPLPLVDSENVRSRWLALVIEDGLDALLPSSVVVNQRLPEADD